MLETRVGADSKVMMEKPAIAGTRIIVELMLEKLATGETISQLVGAHLRLTPEAIQTALTFAAGSSVAVVPGQKIPEA